MRLILNIQKNIPFHITVKHIPVTIGRDLSTISENEIDSLYENYRAEGEGYYNHISNES